MDVVNRLRELADRYAQSDGDCDVLREIGNDVQLIGIEVTGDALKRKHQILLGAVTFDEPVGFDADLVEV